MTFELYLLSVSFVILIFALRIFKDSEKNLDEAKQNLEKSVKILKRAKKYHLMNWPEDNFDWNKHLENIKRN